MRGPFPHWVLNKMLFQALCGTRGLRQKKSVHFGDSAPSYAVPNMPLCRLSLK